MKYFSDPISRSFALLLLLLVSSAIAFIGQQNQVRASAPQVPLISGTPKIVLGENVTDYGEMLQGEVIERDIFIRNDGDEVLNVWRVNPSCGCTKILNKPSQVAPGETVAIRIEVDSKKIKPGDTRKGVTFETDDPGNPRLQFIFTVKVIGLFRTVPEPILLPGLMGKSKSMKIQLFALTDLGFEVKGARSRNGEFEITDFNEIEKDRHYEIEVTAGSSPAPRNVKDPLDLLIAVKDGREVVVGRYVEIHHLDPIQITPARVFQFGNKDTDRLLGDGDPVVTKYIQIQNLDETRPLEVKGVELEGFPDDLFEVEIQELVPGRTFRIGVTLGDYRKEALLRGSLHIITNDSRLPKRSLQMAAKFGRI
ncbi:MAG TPA: DUF1573 domain-containing protein [Planctomycetes bacterium]|nr:DUF1573 domain-containing protein [Planctomycetota bacterium]HIK82596.1 DUF1573 domain-containing protein [Planctomycetota bacterium]